MIIKIGISVVSVCASIGIGYTWCYNVMKRQVQRLSKSNSENNIAHNKQLRAKNDELRLTDAEMKKIISNNNQTLEIYKEMKNLSNQILKSGKQTSKESKDLRQANRILRTHNELLEAYKGKNNFYMVRSKPSKQRRQIIRKVDEV